MAMSHDSERKAFKDWFDAAAAQALAKQISNAYAQFDSSKFRKRATANLKSLEMMGRVEQFATALRAGLPEDIPSALEVLVKSLPEPMSDCESLTDGWLQWPVGFFIGAYGTDYYAESMAAMVALTQRFSAEFAIRPFAEKYPDRVFPELLDLAEHHESPHVRRWASEGIRPRLPWGRKIRNLIDDPSPLWPILDALKDDPELYVRRSVANNLNDIAKDHPELVVKRCREWNKGANDERKWVIRHGLRTLIKQGHPGALAIVGFTSPKKIQLSLKLSAQAIPVGGSIDFTVVLKNEHTRSQKLAVDYQIGFVRQGGKTGKKVFKGKSISLAAGEEYVWNKAHPMKVTTVRRLYPGTHTVAIQVNGEVMAESNFELTE